MPTAPNFSPSGLYNASDCQRGEKVVENVFNSGIQNTSRIGRVRLRPSRSSILGKCGVASGQTTARRTKSSEALQQPRSPMEHPALVRDNHDALPTILDLKLNQQLLILTPCGFPDSLTEVFKKALLSYYSEPPKFTQLLYGNSRLNLDAEASMESATKTIIFMRNVNSDQVALIERTTYMRPLLIMVGFPSATYFYVLTKSLLSGSVLTLQKETAQGLKDVASLIRLTAMLREKEESVDELADSMGQVFVT